MNWFDLLEKKRSLLVFGMITVCIAMLAVTARRITFSPDAYWHLKMGLEWLNNSISPWTDTFSFTFAGSHINNPPVIFQSIIAFLVGHFGQEGGLQVYKFFCYASVIGLITLLLKKLRSPVALVLLVLPTVVFLLQFRPIARPELLSHIFSVLAMLIYVSDRGKLKNKSLILMLALMAVWTNYHQPIFGYIIFFGLYLDAAIERLYRDFDLLDWFKCLFSGLLVLAIGFLNPEFSHPLIETLSFSPEWKEYIQEYQSSEIYLGVPAFYLVVTLTVFTGILSVLKRKFGYLAITVILSISAASMARLITPAGLIILCIFADLISDRSVIEYIRRKPLASRTAGLAVVLMTAVSLYTAIDHSRNFMKANRYLGIFFPDEMVQYMKENNLNGNIFNEYHIGGYLIYRMFPQSKVYIDGRTGILYPVDHYERFLEARNNSAVLQAEDEKYGIDYIILKNNQRAYTVPFNAGDFELDFVDGRYSMFVKGSGRFSVSGKSLAHPYCLNENDLLSLEKELEIAESTLPQNSTLVPYLKFVIDFMRSGSKDQFIKDASTWLGLSSSQLRFAAYQALNLRHHNESAQLFERIEVWDVREYLAATMAYLEEGNWKKAEELANSFTRIKWPEIGETEILIASYIFKKLSTLSDSLSISKEYIDSIHSQAAMFTHKNEGAGISPAQFCDIP